MQLISFISIVAALAWLCRAQLGNPRCHGFYRYFAFIGIAWLLMDAVPVWGDDPWSLRQILSQCLMLGSLVFLVGGLYELNARGGRRQQVTPKEHFQFENTARLVTTGLYRGVRHPMYTSLLLLNWGLFLKCPGLPGLTVAVVVSVALYLTARIEERENLALFGADYARYRQSSRMFLPWLC